MNYMCKNTCVTRNHARKMLKMHQINVIDVLIATATVLFLHMLMYSHLQGITKEST